ncbi:MAG TPA: hypothetical protein VGF89_01080 [Steroidobacteraceae bacterium]|jgi:hypothetical protein
MPEDITDEQTAALVRYLSRAVLAGLCVAAARASAVAPLGSDPQGAAVAAAADEGLALADALLERLGPAPLPT